MVKFKMFTRPKSKDLHRHLDIKTIVQVKGLTGDRTLVVTGYIDGLSSHDTGKHQEDTEHQDRKEV